MNQETSGTTTLVSEAVVQRWNEEYKKGSDKQFPNLDLVRLEKWHFGANPGRLLEYGSGCGVNLIYLLEQGYHVDAIDASIEAVKLVKSKLAQRPELNAKATLHHISPDSSAIPFEDSTFDFVNCISVLSLLATRERVQQLVNEFYRVLKPGGKILADINGITSDFASKGTHLGNDIYEFPGGDGFDPFQSYCPDNEEKFYSLFDKFEIDNTGYSGHSYMGSEIFEYIVCAHKPEI